jgi:beta-glucosidase/6-phospho-beta-glucosidase/beta-galactosidase
MGHYDHWQEDLQLIGDAGLKSVRWGVPWYRVAPSPAKYDWKWTDEVISCLVEEYKVLPIIDLMHYGCPLWLEREFAHRDYPRYVADYAAEFAMRYKHLVNWYTPLNEPIINSMMCGLRGLWPPYLKGDKGYLRIMLQLAKGIVRTVKSIRAIDPSAVMVHVEATGLNRTVSDDLKSLAREEELRGFLCFDLISGRLDHNHELFSWLVRNGAVPDSLVELEQSRCEIDVLGLNFYPQWSTRQLYIDKKGRLAFRETEQEGEGFEELIMKYHQRYGVPVMITETSAVGTDEVRSRWLESSVGVIKRIRGAGIPVIGYTWFPLFTMVDWRYRFGGDPVENYYLELGLYRLNRSSEGPRWEKSRLVDQYRSYIENSVESIGEIIDQSQARALQGPSPSGDRPAAS